MKTTKQGTILKKLDNRTAVVDTFRMKVHPVYKKRFKIAKKYLADDKDGKFKVGEVVLIRECRPISKTKRFEVIESVGKKLVGEDEIVGEEVLGAEAPIKDEVDEEISK